MLPGIVPAIARPRYRPNAVNFDGTTTVLSRGAGLTGAVDGTQMLCSAWLKKSADTSGTPIGGIGVAGAAGSRVAVLTSSLGAIKLTGSNSSGTVIGDIASSASYLAASGWNHFLASFDLTSTSKRWVFVNDVSDLATVATYTNASIDWTLVDWFISGGGTSNAKWSGDMADMMLWPTYLDLSVTANRRLFIDSIRKPVDPAAAIAALGAPLIRLSGATSGWPTNKGGGGGFTLSGTLADATTRPGD